MRLQKFIAHAGLCSRRAAERLILQGRVRVNGEIVGRPGVSVDPVKDIVLVDGQEVKLKERYHYIMLHKPRGILTTARDPFNRQTVLHLLRGLDARVYPVGRLDLNSEGLLLLTNDGELANRLIHPRYKVEKRYIVHVKGHPSRESVACLASGIELDGKITQPCRIGEKGRGNSWTSYEVILKEGRKRQIRRMFKAIGHEGTRLIR